MSNSGDSERDLLCRGPSVFFLWCVPWCAFAVGFGQAPWLRTISWSTSLAVMGGACLLISLPDALITHTYVPILMLGVALSAALLLRRTDPDGKWIGGGTIVGALGLCCIPSCFSVGIDQKAPNLTRRWS